MLKGLVRLAGFLLVVAGFVQVVIDGTRSIAAEALVYTTLAESGHHYLPLDYATFADRASALLGARFWPLLGEPALRAPTALVLVAGGLVLLLLARRRAEKIGHPARL